MIYLGRLPHGFFEDQLKAYFSQFGDVLRVRVSRNKKVKYYTPSAPFSSCPLLTIDHDLLLILVTDLFYCRPRLGHRNTTLSSNSTLPPWPKSSPRRWTIISSWVTSSPAKSFRRTKCTPSFGSARTGSSERCLGIDWRGSRTTKCVSPISTVVADSVLF